MSLLRRTLNLLSRSRVDREIDIELASHIEMRIEDNLAAGMTPEDGRRDALLRFGNRTATKERVVNMDVAPFLASVWSDVSYTCRQLVRNPGFASTAILVLALGICASVAIFAFVDAVLITPLPYKSPSRLVGLFESTPLGPRFHLSHLDYLDWQKLNHVFTSVEAFDQNTLALKTATGVQRTDGVTVGAGFFRLLGITPILGRDFRPGEDTAGAPRTVILTYSAWEKRFGKQPDVLGKTVTLNGATSVIVGVLPQWFQFAPAGPAEFWMPLQSSPKPEERGEHGMIAFARLRDGVSLQIASADMSTIAQLLAKQYPDADEGRGATVVPLTELIVGSLRPTLLLLLSGAALLLLIACVNVSGLLLVHLQSRQRELAVRGALGASSARLTRQLTTEAVVLTSAGTSLGLGTAYGAIQLLRQLIPLDMLNTMPYLNGLGLKAHVLLFAAAVGLACALLLSLIAIARAPLSNLQSGLTAGGRGTAGTVWRHLGANMVVLELCTAMVLLAGAGLLCKSLYKVLHTEIGLQPDHLAVVRMWAPPSRYSKDEQIIALARHVMDEVRRLPGVQSVAVAHQIPLANLAGGSSTFEIIGSPRRQENNEANSRQVSSSYFTTVQARLFAGRWFTETDDASRPHVAIVNRVFAQKYLAGEDPVGKSIRFDASQPPIEIVGIVDNINEGPPDADVQPALYTPFNQGPDGGFFVIVRTAQTPGAILTALEEAIHGVDPNILTVRAETMEGRIHNLESTWLRRSAAWLSGGFAAMALLLGVVGLYGVIAYSVSQRTREIGVRIALGAQRGSVYRLILAEAGRLIAAGVGIGLLAAIGTATLMSKLLFRTQPWDGGTLAAVASILAIFAISASFIPARRAAAVEPTEALRAE
jgi:macrolide transport system ATP-binding/permease protein